MADITFSGLATGMDTDSIVKQMMEIERRPIERLEKQKESEASRLLAFKQFDERLNSLRDAVGSMNLTSEVRESSIDLSPGAPFTATSTGAGTGSYDVAVKQLAQVQKSVADGVSSASEGILGTGTITIGSTTINIDESNNSLQGLQEAINAAAGETGVKASIMNDGSGSDTAYHLVLTGQDANTSFDPAVDLTGGESLVFQEMRSAQQAVVEIDGIEVFSDSNTVSGVIPGIDLHLNATSEVISAAGDPVEYQTSIMNVEPDTTALKEKVQNFVDSYNSVMDWISAGYDTFGASRPSAAEVEAGADDILSDLVRGDSAINGTKRQLQDLLSTQVNTSGDFSVLSQLGISTQRDGSLSLDEAKLNDAVTNNFDDVVSLLAGEGSEPGVMKHFNSALLDITGVSSGIYADKKDSYEDTLKSINSQIDRMEMLAAKREETMRAQFSSLELLVAEMNAQSDYITQQMDMLSNMVTGSK
jgi:flagellar hook-associated protein 2